MTGRVEPGPGLNLSELEHSILDELRADPRATNKSIADKLGVREATIAARIRAMHQAGVMRLTAKRDFRAAGFHVLAHLDVEIRDRLPKEVARDFMDMDFVSAISVMAGTPSIILQVQARSLSDLGDIVLKKISRVDGVFNISTNLLFDIVKYRTDYSSNLRD